MEAPRHVNEFIWWKTCAFLQQFGDTICKSSRIWYRENAIALNYYATAMKWPTKALGSSEVHREQFPFPGTVSDIKRLIWKARFVTENMSCPASSVQLQVFSPINSTISIVSLSMEVNSCSSDSEARVECGSPKKFRTLRKSDKLVLRTSWRADGNCSSSSDHDPDAIILAPNSPLNSRHSRLVLKRKMKYVCPTTLSISADAHLK